MELDPENLPTYPLCVRVTPLDVSGSPLRISQGDDAPSTDDIVAFSDDFFLSKDPPPTSTSTRTSTRRTTPTIAFGRIEALLAATAKQTLNESEPQQNATNTNFSLRVSEHRLINLSLRSYLKNYIAVGHRICCSYERRLIAPKGESHEHTNRAKAVPN